MIAQGVASGEFEAPDVPLAAMCVCTGMMRFFHPQMIAQCANKPGPSIDQMIDFVLARTVAAGKGDEQGSRMCVRRAQRLRERQSRSNPSGRVT